VTSGLSPYLSFGHISPHGILRAIAEREEWQVSDLLGRARGRVRGFWNMSEDSEAFLDQLVTWRELGFNMAWQRSDYTTYAAQPEWARRTLEKHRSDPRSPTYSLSQLAAAETHDRLWNAAQRQLLGEGRIHNAVRMLWGKKILEWTSDPELAFETLVNLNDRYALDGRDPNSYSGVGWCLGRYDRAWGPERRVFGTVRYMSSENSQRKWKPAAYMQRWADPPRENPAGRMWQAVSR
jgi:deoxyribodipyrimidine photo-lyase